MDSHDVVAILAAVIGALMAGGGVYLLTRRTERQQAMKDDISDGQTLHLLAEYVLPLFMPHQDPTKPDPTIVGQLRQNREQVAQLSASHGEIIEKIDELATTVRETATDQSRLRTDLREHMGEEERLRKAEIEERLARQRETDLRFERVDRRFDLMDRKLDALHGQMSSIPGVEVDGWPKDEHLG